MFFSLIAKTIWARRTRSLLTVAGLGISIALIIAIFSLATGMRKELGISAQITQANLVAVQRGIAGPIGGSIPESCIEDIQRYDGVDRATGFLLTSVSLPGIPSFNLFGVRLEDRELYLGERQIIEGGYIQNPGEIGLGKIARESLGLQVGDNLTLESGEEFTVAGVYETGNVYLDSGGIISLREAQDVSGREGKVTLIAIYSKPGADENKIAEDIQADKRYLKVIPSPALLESSSSVQLVNTFAWVLSAIAVVMAGIGVLNTMSMSVSGQTGEMVLGESLLLALGGFVVGSLLGVGIIWVVATLPAVQGFVSPSFDTGSFLVGLAIALLLGLLGGAVPAYTAFRLSPVDALHHD
jgi:putative ABC transport system permease protein